MAKGTKIGTALFWIALVIVFGTHIYMLATGKLIMHAITNLVAGAMLLIYKLTEK